MNRNKEEELLNKYRDGHCTEAELEQLHTWYANWHIEDRAMLSEAKLISAEALMREEVAHRLGFDLAAHTAQSSPEKNRRLWPHFAVAAAAVATIVLGIWFFSVNTATNEIAYANDVAPGKNTATLTLPTGETILLSDAKTGVVVDASALTYADGTAVTMSEDLESASTSSTRDMTVETPRGGTYQVILPDGTKVWLNAASSITFPARFGTGKREVTASGEIYFEVLHDASRPFIVSSPNQELEVLGTHFNINSYSENAGVATTLVEGSVKVKGKILKPGQQSLTKAEGIQISSVDVREAVAWKEGNFRFNDLSVPEIMKQIARWYDVEVIYEDDLSDIRLNAAISRNRNISQVLKMMEKTDEVRFKIEGRRVFVSK